MKRQPRPPKQYDFRTAVVSADALRAHAHIFIAFVGSDMETAHHRAAQHIGGLVASATELSLAVELYFKAIWMRLGLRVPETHHLWSLFKDLPDSSLKASITKSYDQLNASTRDDVVSLIMAISVGHFDEAQLEKADKLEESKQHQTGIKDVLVRSSNAFQTWRYLFEQGRSGEVRFLEYEFARIDMVAAAARAHAVLGTELAQNAAKQDALPDAPV